MTYRRLFLWLFIGSTLLLAGVWTLSMKSHTLCILAPKPLDTYFMGTLHSNTIQLSLHTPVPAATIKMPSSFEFTTDPSWLAIVGKGMGPFGSFKMKTFFSQGTRGTGTRIRSLGFPLWFPWLLATAGGYLLMRRMEKRSESGKEKRLAEQHAEAGLVRGAEEKS